MRPTDGVGHANDIATNSMTDDLFTAVDAYLATTLGPPDSALAAALDASTAAGLPDIQITPTEGKLLHLLARAIGARRILEIGTLGGYSTIWLARALPADGRLVTLEVDRGHAEVALTNVARAGVAERVALRLGAALDTLPVLAAEGAAAFDLVFIDADKKSIPAYFEWALRLTRPGSVVVVDNVVRRGAVLDASSEDADVQGVRRFIAQLATDRRVSATALQTVGSKGHDGFALALVLAPER